MLSDDIVVNFIIANDVNTFLKLPEVEHPAAKILVNLNKFHDQTFRCHYCCKFKELLRFYYSFF
ncbi:hypothetical protein BpHYR1_001847 [Brachionus plicatilis]|uniref:T-complex 1 subunit alpha n=1 Tax=Brachionus plicatilis TaxID=10195 RepID=A0A3M7PYI4_BRAPC|nr:hypothetical protein BpHYR1_001847 [Brachionus plicatilis]